VSGFLGVALWACVALNVGLLVYLFLVVQRLSAPTSSAPARRHGLPRARSITNCQLG